MTSAPLRPLVMVALVLGMLLVPLGRVGVLGNVARIGVLSPFAPSPLDITVLLDALRDLGWTAGQNLAVEERWASHQYERLPQLAAELVQRQVEVLVAMTTPAALAAKEATTTIPIVMMFVSDAEHEGLVASLARPGGNLTGVSSAYDALIGKRLELLKEVVPGLSRVGALYNPAFPGMAIARRETQTAAQALGVRVAFLEVRAWEELDRVFAAIRGERLDALLVIADPLLLTHAGQIAHLAIRSGLPTMFEERSPIERGGLMTYGVHWREVVRRAATYVDKILKGRQPADLPVEQPMTFELVLNLKTAQALGLTIPPSLLLQATEVIR